MVSYGEGMGGGYCHKWAKKAIESQRKGSKERLGPTIGFRFLQVSVLYWLPLTESPLHVDSIGKLGGILVRAGFDFHLII